MKMVEALQMFEDRLKFQYCAVFDFHEDCRDVLLRIPMCLVFIETQVKS